MKHRIVGLLLVGPLALVACGTEGGEETTTTDDTVVTTTSGESEATTTSAGPDETTTTAATEEMDGVHASETDLGTILVDPEGYTLYIFTQDSDGESACNDACAELWPPVPADTPISSELDQAMFGSIERADGSQQLTVNGMPLYLYTPDVNPGDTTGQGFSGVWFVVGADGNPIQAAEATDDGYGY
jgi:predicted lipoprotein with Yx(FWY)xxD motif